MISVCLPTRGRPERFAEMFESVKATAAGPVEVVAVLDEDDETTPCYPAGPRYLTVRRGHKQSDLWNVAWQEASGAIAHMGADDLVYRTRGWDRSVERAFMRWYPDRIGMVYGNDLNPVSDVPFHGQRASEQVDGRYVFAANPFVSRAWIQAAGFFTPPFYKSWEADTWIYQLADGISRAVYLHNVVIEHLHPMAGKAPMDATYERGAWGKPLLRRKGWAVTKSPEMRALRARQVRDLTSAIQGIRSEVVG